MIFWKIFFSDERFQYIHCIWQERKNNEGMIDTSYIKAFAKWRQVGDFAGDLASRFQPNLSRPFFSESKMAAVASESEQVVDQANENTLAEEKPADEKLTEEQPKEGGKLSH